MDYESDHYVFEKELEEKYLLRENLLENHSVTPEPRESTLVYLIRVCDFLKLTPDILHHTVSIFDRFSQQIVDIPIYCLRLVIIGSLRITLKLFHRQNDLPFTSELVVLVGDVYTASQIFSVEKKICSVLEFNLVYPTSFSFLSRLNKLTRGTILQQSLGMYLLEILFLNYSSSGIKPSLQAAGACCLSTTLLDNSRGMRNIWPENMERASSFGLAELRPVLRLLVQSLSILSKVGVNSFLYAKYARSENFMVSTFQQIRDPVLLGTFSFI